MFWYLLRFSAIGGFAVSAIPEPIQELVKGVRKKAPGFVKRLIGGFYKAKGPDERKRRKKVSEELRRHKVFHWLRLIPDVGRISSGRSQETLLLAIFAHTIGAPHDTKLRGWKAPVYTPAMIPEDFSIMTGFTKEQVRLDIEDAVARGLIARRSQDEGLFLDDDADKAWYQFRLRLEDWAGLKDYEDGTKRRPPKSAISDESLEDEDLTDENGEESQPSAVGRNAGLKLKGGSGWRVVKSGECRKVGELVWGGDKVPLVADNRRKEVQLFRPEVKAGEVRLIFDEKERAAVPPQKVQPIQERKPQANGEANSKNGHHRRVNLAEFPQVTEFITDDFKDTDMPWMARLVGVCQEAIIRGGLSREDLTDEALVEAARATRKRNQVSAGLYLTKMPAIIERWAREERARRE